MKIKYISDDYELYLIQQRYSFQYDLIIDCISKKDNFTMYKVQKTCRSDPSDIIYHAFYYDHQRKHTPLDIAVNSRTNIIEYISFFVSDSMKINSNQFDSLFIDKNEYCLFSMIECNDTHRYFKIENEKDNFVYFYENNSIFYLNNRHPCSLNMYCICDFCWLLIVAAAVFFAAGLWKLRRQPADDAGGRELRRLRIENRTLWLFIALLLLVSRIDRICEF